MTTLTSRVGQKLGIQIPTNNGKVLSSKTPLNRILKDDLKELTARNIKKLGFNQDKVASQMSNDISQVYFGEIT
jgi:hypothetical protein